MLRAGVGRVKLMPLPRSDVCGVVCAARCVMCVGQAVAHVLCLVAPEMSELQRCPGDAAFGVSIVYMLSSLTHYIVRECDPCNCNA